MARTIIIAAVIILIIFLGAAVSFMYTENIITGFADELRNLSELDEIHRIREDWDDKKNVLMLFMNHRDIEEVSVALIRATEEAKTGEEADAKREISLAVFLMEELVEREKLSAENIF